MAITIQFRVNGGAVQTGVATVVAEDEVDLRLASYTGLQSIRYEIQEYPSGFAQPTGWSTDASSGAYYYTAGPISGLTPPTITMPTSVQIGAGQWGKWIFRAVATTASGTVTSDPRCGVQIVSPALGLKGIAFTEEDEFNAQRAWPGDLQADLVEIDDAALVSGGFVSSLTATAPIARNVATGDVTVSWNPTANVGMGGYGFTSCTGVANASGAVTISAGSGDLTLDASATVKVGPTSATRVELGRSGQTVRHPALAGVGTRFVTVDANGDEGVTASAGASATAAYWEDTATAVNTNGIPTRNLAATLYVKSSADRPMSLIREDASDDSPLTVLVLHRVSSGGAGDVGIGARLTWSSQDAAGDEPGVGHIDVVLTDATAGVPKSQFKFWAAPGDGGSAHLLGSWDADAGLVITGDLTVSGTTTTVDSTTVNLADRLVVFNSSTGIVVAPIAIAGFVVDRGSTDGVTKRDAPGVLWDEANSRFAFAHNTGLDQSTIGTYVTVRAGAILTPSLDTPTASALTIGGTATAVSITAPTTVQRDGLGAVSDIGLELLNDTATDGVATEQRPPYLYFTGHGRATSGGTDVEVNVRIGTVLTAAGSNPTVELYFQRQLAGGGWLTWGYFTSSLPSIGGSGFYTQNTFLVSTTSNGYRIDQGSGALGGVKASSGIAVFESQGSANRAEIWSAIATASTDDGVRVWNNAGTRSDGYLMTVGTGSSWSQKFGVRWDGAAVTHLFLGNSAVTVQSNGSTDIITLSSNLATGNSSDGIRAWNRSGTRSAGNLFAVGDGASWTQKWAVQYDGATITTRVVAAPSTPSSSASAVTFDLSASQNIVHTITEDTTVTITGGSVGQAGRITFLQDGTGRTITMPSPSGSIEYIDSIQTLGTTAMVDTAIAAKTIFYYQILPGPLVLIDYRATSLT